jgi:hypothetical protein
MLKYLLFGAGWLLGRSATAATEVVAHLNLRAKRAKAYERDFLYLRSVLPGAITKVSGVVLKPKDELRSTWSVYVPEWKRTVVAGGSSVAPGDRVELEVYSDLRRPAWRERIVCRIKESI